MESQNKNLARILSATLDGAAVAVGETDARGATRISANGSFGNLQFSAIWAGPGWPADVRQALGQVPPGEWPGDLVVVAQRLSPGAVALLEDRGANWVDETGAARVIGPGILILQEGKDEPRSRRAFSWSPSAVAVAEGLLARSWSNGIGTTELATLIQWSPPQVSQVLQSFDDEGWTIKYGPQRGRGARRELVDAEGLLESWAESIATKERNERQAHRTLRSPLDFLEGELAEALEREVRWALSGWAAAHELAPMAGGVPSLQIYVHEDDFDRALDRAIADAGLSNVAEGGRVTFISAQAGVLALVQATPTGPLVSSPRVYADLLALGGRGEDAAEHLKEEVLDRLHPPRARRSAPQGIIAWEKSTRDRLDYLAHRHTPDLADVYAHGTWSASYRLTGVPESPGSRKFLGILREVAGRESGWPPWWIPETGESRPQPVDGAIECWFSDLARNDPANADYWRADRDGRLCLIRTYQEDWELGKRPAAGTALDLVLPILRSAECLGHAGRLADRLEATGIQFMMRWTGLQGRAISSLLPSTRRWIPPGRKSAQDEVVSFVEVPTKEIGADLAGVVKRLLEPLYASFGFFEPPPEIYEEELRNLASPGEDR